MDIENEYAFFGALDAVGEQVKSILESKEFTPNLLFKAENSNDYDVFLAAYAMSHQTEKPVFLVFEDVTAERMQLSLEAAFKSPIEDECDEKCFIGQTAIAHEFLAESIVSENTRFLLPKNFFLLATTSKANEAWFEFPKTEMREPALAM